LEGKEISFSITTESFAFQKIMNNQQLFGIGEISLYATKTFKYKDQYAFRYYFNTWKKIEHCGEDCVLFERFYVCAEAIDIAYKIAAQHLYRELNEKVEGVGFISDYLVLVGDKKYEVSLNVQHEEIILEDAEDFAYCCD
jgi:hypothetical protein